MIAQAKRRAAEAAAEVSFAVCRWEHLPEAFAEKFDLAVCCGNAIGHCRDPDEMLRSLRGIRAVLAQDGCLVLDTRNWQKLLAEKVRFTTLGPRERDGKRCIPLNVQTFPERDGDPVVIEVLLIFEQDGKAWLKSHPITYYPFRVAELIGRLEAAGFCDVEIDYEDDKDSYAVTARAAPERGRP
jgi:SAM-dependent methyltransferase